MDSHTDFSSEEELLSHLGLTYQKAVENRCVSVPSQVQDLLSVVKAFIKTNTDVEVSQRNICVRITQLCCLAADNCKSWSSYTACMCIMNCCALLKYVSQIRSCCIYLKSEMLNYLC